jgi:hypothetical protein
MIQEFDPTVRSFDAMYPAMAVAALSEQVKFFDKSEFDPLFDVMRRVNELPQFTKCISVSLYCQKGNNQFAHQHGTIDHRNVSLDWYDWYVRGLLSLIGDLGRDDDLAGWKVRVHLERQLEYLIPSLLAAGSKVEIFLMQSDSIGAGPGMIWRLLAFDDKALEVVFVMDVDDRLASRKRFITAFAGSSKCLGRPMPGYKRSFAINRANPRGSPMNYAAVPGGIVGFRPRMSHICMRDVVVNYMAHRKQRVTSGRFPNRESDDDPDTLYNVPIGGHRYGWGGHWYMYGFDEKLLKHVVFPHFVRLGQVETWVRYDATVLKTLPAYHPCRLDYEFCSQFEGNEYRTFGAADVRRTRCS